MTLRTRLLIAFLGLALVPTALLTVISLDRLQRAIALWNTRAVDQALESALEVSKTSMTRMEATVLAQADDWALALPPDSLSVARRTAMRAGLRAAGLDFMQLYRRDGGAWRLVDEVLPVGVLTPEPLDLADELAPALTGPRTIHSPRGALAAVAPMDSVYALVAGMRVPPGFFAQFQRIGDGMAFYRRFGVVRDVSRTYTLFLIGALAIVLIAVAAWVSNALAGAMTRPLRRLEEALERVAEGDLETRVAPSGASELQHLGRRFNTMTGRLAAARQALAEAEREATWREVARRLAHEFKNLLTPMSLSLHRLRRRSDLVPAEHREAVGESLGSLGQGVDDLTRLAEQFSQYARLPEPRFEPIDLRALAAGAAQLHEPERHEVRVMAGPEPVWVMGDRLLLSRAVHNLLLNALEASPHGGTVEVRVGTAGDEAVLEVFDRGSGLPPDVGDRLFEPYVSTKRRGSGLGLSLVRDIVGQHRGTVTLQNREGGGAHARIALPMTTRGTEVGG